MNSSFQPPSDDDVAILIFGDFDGLQEGFAHFFSVILALHSRSLFFSHAFFTFLSLDVVPTSCPWPMSCVNS